MKRAKDATLVIRSRATKARARSVENVDVARDQQPEPRLPHEHDESADSQQRALTQPTEVGRKAFEDVRAGRVDTDRGPVLQELFEADQRDRAAGSRRKR